MKNKFLQRALAMVVVAVFFCSSIIPAFAEGQLPEPQKTGTLAITMNFHGEPVSGGRITIYYVGVPTEDGTSYSYAYAKDFEFCDSPLSDLSDKELPKDLADYVDKAEAEGIEQDVDEKGLAFFDDLKEGLYLVIETESPDHYDPVPPFIFEMPHYDSESEEWDYDVEAQPKIHPEVKPDTSTTPQEMSPDDYQPSRPDTSVLPHTGQLNWPIPVLAFAGILLFIIGWSMYYKKGNK